MSFFQPPTAFRLRDGFPSADTASFNSTDLLFQTLTTTAAASADILRKKLPPHSQHPPLANLVLLVFEAVLEVVCISLPGYIIARQGMFDASNQKFVANLNVSLFTPCLIFTKLASQLTVDKLAELAIIPAIFVVMTAVSYLSSILIARLFNFRRRARNFVVAMGVFGNSNSLPMSLVMSLASTLQGLHWNKIPGDNDSDVAARGILYLLIFQQLGQLLRWSWGYHVLLAPPNTYTIEEGGTMDVDEVDDSSVDGADDILYNTARPADRLLGEPDRYTRDPVPIVSRTESIDSESEWDSDIETGSRRRPTDPFRRPTFTEYEGLQSPPSGGGRPPFIGRPITGMSRHDSERIRSHSDRLMHPRSLPLAKAQQETHQQISRVVEVLENHQAESHTGSSGSGDEDSTASSASVTAASSPVTSRPDSPTRARIAHRNSKIITSFPEPENNGISTPASSKVNLLKNVPIIRYKVSRNLVKATKWLPPAPAWTRKPVDFFRRFMLGLWAFMNPPLWAMLGALLVASVPALQKLFFTPGTFVETSVTRAVKQSGNVAVPLILVVLGANLAGNTASRVDDASAAAGHHHKATARHERNILVAALISRMLMPTMVVAPLLALAAKFLPVSLLGDPIFVIVCFLLAGAPSALQLSQICQLNGVYEDVMAKILFWSYVVVILPSTLFLVVCGLEVLEWSHA